MVDSVSDQSMLSPEVEQNGSEDHIALIYETAEEGLSTLTQLIRAGLEKGEICLHISNGSEEQNLVEALKAGNIDVDKAVSNGSLILTTKDEVYFKMGRFDPDWTIRVIQNIADLAKDYGFTAMRIISEMTWVLEKLPGVERWAEYETKLNSLAPGIKVRTVCQYDRRAFPPEALLAAVKAHPKVAFHGSICKNHFFMPADLLLKGGSASVELDHILDSIRRSSSWEADRKGHQLEIEQIKKRVENETASRKRLEAALEESRRRFSEFAESISDWAWEIGRDGSYTYSSPRVKDILGLQPEEVIGKSPLELVAESEAERVSAALARAVSQHAPITALEKEARHKDGRTVFLEMSGTPLFDRDGEFAGYRGIDRDITERKTAKLLIDEGRKRAEESKAEAEAKGQRIISLEEEIVQLQGILEERDTALVFINEALATSQHDLEMSKGEFEQAKSDREQLRSSLRAKEEELEVARRTIGEKDAAIAAVKATIAEREETIAEKASIVEQKEASLAELQEAVQAKASELSSVREALAGAQDAVTQKDADIITLRQQMDQMEAELRTARETILQKEGELEAARAQVEQLGADLACIQADLESRTGEFQASQGTMSQKEEALSLANAKIEQLNADLDKATAELSAAVALVEGTKADLATRTEELQAAQEVQASLENERRRLIQLVREESDLLGSMRETVAKYSAELSERESLIASLQAAAAFRESELVSRRAAAESHAKETEEKAREADGLREKLKAAETELSELRARLAESLEADEGKAASISQLSTELEEREKEIRAAKAAIDAKATEMARHREALNESSGRFRALFEQAGVAVTRTDLEGRLLEANGKFFEMLDRSQDELEGATYHDYVHRDDMIFIAGLYDQLVSGRARSGTIPVRFIRKLGTAIQVSISMSVVRDERGEPKYVMALIEDRTEQMLAEQALLEKEKESTVSTGATAEAAKATELPEDHQQIIAHDLNDSLTVIMGSVSLAKEYVIPEGRMYQKLKQIESASSAARDLASRLISPTPVHTESTELATPRLLRGKGKILLMDDDESVLEAIGDLLRYLGYTVEVARDGEEALSLCREARESGNPFDLAILDIAVTSGMGGMEAAQTMQAENPGLRLAVSSGFLTDPAMADPGAFGFDMAIAKPYSAELLSKKVVELIARG